MDNDTPLTSTETATLWSLDFDPRPVKTCEATRIHTCPSPAFHVATRRCCGRQDLICDAHALAMSLSTVRLVCRECDYAAPLRDLFRLAPIGDRL